MSVSLGGGKSRNSTTSRSNIDPASAQYLTEIMNAARQAGASGPSPLLTGASDYYTKLMQQGGVGSSALAGDADATKALMNPYQQQVIDATNNQWNTNDQYTTNAINDQATKTSAFGGSRHGVAQGVALGENNRNRNNAVSGLLYGGFNDAMGRAGQLAGLGYNAAGQNANLGMGGVGNPGQWLMQMLRQGFLMPQGQWGKSTSTGTGLNASGIAGKTD